MTETFPVESAVVEECEIRRQKTFAVPCGRRVRVFSWGVHTGFHRCLLMPHRFAGQRHLVETFHALICGDVEKLLPVFFANFDTMTAALKLTSEGSDKLSFRVKHKD